MSTDPNFSVLKNYSFALIITAIILLWAVLASGPAAIATILILTVTEITFSFENAVLNSQILARLSKFWQTLFLTVGIVIAVFGVRIVLPLILVSSAAGLSLGHVLDLALNDPKTYSEELHHAYPVIAAFGGVFLLMIGLRFFSEKHEDRWIPAIERPIEGLNRPWLLPIAGAMLVSGLIYTVIMPGDMKVFAAAIIGAVTYIAIKAISIFLEKKYEASGALKKGGQVVGMMAFTQFMYLELLDASFSFDGVIAAFAITQDVILIAAGLGIGALFVRSMTIHLMRTGTLGTYRYLIHGAHYAILVLGFLLISSMVLHVPEPVTGFIGITLIIASLMSSIKANKKEAAAI
ncbi:MAG: hypothetical protein JWL85_937 [Candidatus Saccharibacteria bacterium]|nr:hypothetical protein [Candidatus Saccharibacteria bacterium]